MKTRSHVLTHTLASLLGLASTCSALAAPTASASALIEKGRYLAQAGDCVACHTKKGGAPLAGGRALDTPFGPLISPNITPDKDTGIGNWSDDDFYRLMHEGIGKQGEYIYPVMPFPWYTIVTRDDALAIKAYLFSIPPVHSPRPENTLSFPFSIRSSLLAWRQAFFKPTDFQGDPQQSEQVNRGSYLVNGLAHCGECHNARPIAGTSRWREPLAGGTIQNWYAPNISSDMRSGIGAWSNGDLVSFLKTGTAPGKGVAVGPMAETVHSLSHLTDGDLAAIAAYLKTTPPVAETAQQSDPAQPFERGSRTYLDHCASCHGVDGEGLAGVVPALKDNGAVLAAGPQNVISVVLGGLQANGTLAPMPAIGSAMSDGDVADVTNYVRQAWSQKAPATATNAMAFDLRAQVDGLLNAAPRTGCPPVANAELVKALGTATYRTQLSAVTDAGMYQQTGQLVAQLRKSNRAVPDADLINGLTAAYCPIVRADPELDQNAKALKIGRFANYVYMAVAGGPEAKMHAKK
ncbi:MAG: cytochrome c [Dokdonella sp.]